MNRHIFSAALATLAFTLPSAAQAQQLPAPVIAVVNTDQIFETCTQCAAASTQLQAQGTQLQQRAQQLQTQIQTEGNALEPLVRAAQAAGQQPDAALTARIQAYQTMQQNAEREIGAGRERVQRNLNFVRQQIGQRIRPAITTVMQQRGATIVLDRGGVIDAAPALDITAAVLAIVNQNTTPLNVTAPPPQQQPAQQQPAQQQQQQQQRPRPQGR
jgi:outer membrane protein